MKPWMLKLMLNLYPPYFGAGVKVERISDDFLEADVSMKLRWYNRNYVRTHFGGSLYSMVDPFFMLLLLQHLGRDHIVWDQAANIEFRRPGRGRVRANFRLKSEDVARIRSEAAGGAPFRPVFPVEILDEEGTLVARVEKTLYVRKKPEK